MAPLDGGSRRPRTLVTGATGFLGVPVVHALVARGAEVYALQRPGSAKARGDDLPAVVPVCEADVLTGAGLEAVIDQVRPEVCVHLAWSVPPGHYAYAVENVDWLAATTRLARLLAQHGCRRLVAAGTCFEYDTELGYLREDGPTRPRTLYGAAKLGTYHILEQLAAASGVETAWLRLFYLYGPREQEGRLVSSIIPALIRKNQVPVTLGEQVRDFLFVDDAAAAIAAVACSGLEGAVNVGSGEPVTVRRLVSTLADLCEARGLVDFGAIPYRPYDPFFVCANTAKLRGATGWSPTRTLEDGLRTTVSWWRDHLAAQG